MTEVRAERPDLMIVLDGHDIERLADFWSSALDGAHCWYAMADPEGNEFCVVGD